MLNLAAVVGATLVCASASVGCDELSLGGEPPPPPAAATVSSPYPGYVGLVVAIEDAGVVVREGSPVVSFQDGALDSAKLTAKLKSERTGAERVHLLAYPDARFQAVAAVVEALTAAGVDDYALGELKRGQGRTPTRPDPPATISTVELYKSFAPASGGQGVVVTNAADGGGLGTSGRNDTEGCRTWGHKAPTVPKTPELNTATKQVDYRHDFAGLSLCAARLKRASKATKVATVAASGDTAYGEVLDVSEALRAAADGPMFTHVRHRLTK